MDSSHRWWVNWRDPIFNQNRATADDFETGQELRRTESEPDLTFNYSKLTGEIDGDDDFMPNGNIKIARGRSREAGSGATKTRTTAKSRAGTGTTSRQTTASRRGSKSGTGTRNQSATSTACSSRY